MAMWSRFDHGEHPDLDAASAGDASAAATLELAKADDTFDKFVIMLVLAVPAYVVIGQVGSHLWRWFVARDLAGSTQISPPEFVGLWLFVRFVFGASPMPKRQEQTPRQYMSELVGNSIVFPLFVLCVGWCIKEIWL